MPTKASRPARGSPAGTRQALLDEISARGLGRGAMLPSIREISRRHRVTKAAAERAVRSLVADGVCYAEQGRGVFLAVDGPRAVAEQLAPILTIGVVFGFQEYPATDHPFYRQVYEGAQFWIAENRHNVLKLYQWRKKSTHQKGREIARFAGSLDGLMALGIYSDEDCILLRDTGLPLVVLDYDTEMLGIDSVILDNPGIMCDLARRVVEEAPGDIFMVMMERIKDDDPAHLERRAAVERVLGEAGRSLSGDRPLFLAGQAGPDDRERLLPLAAVAGRRGRRPALIVSDDYVAVRAIGALSADGLAPGRDYLLAYAGPQDLPAELRPFPALIGSYDFREMGRAGSRLLEERTQKGLGRPVKLAVTGRVTAYSPKAGEQTS